MGCRAQGSAAPILGDGGERPVKATPVHGWAAPAGKGESAAEAATFAPLLQNDYAPASKRRLRVAATGLGFKPAGTSR
jgi:hypothetical protein